MDWKKIKAEYIAGGTSYRKLADKYGVSRTTLERKAKEEKWTKLRRQTEGKTEAKIVDSISTQGAKNAVDVMSVADKLLNRISELIDKSTEGNIKTLTSALKDIRDIKGVKSDADMREQEARIAKLQKEAMEDDNSITEFKVTFGGASSEEAKEWAE